MINPTAGKSRPQYNRRGYILACHDYACIEIPGRFNGANGVCGGLAYAK